MEKNLNELSETIQQQPESKEDARFTLLTTDEAIMNRSEQSFKRRTKNLMVVTTMEQIKTPAIHSFRAYTQIIENGNAKLRLIIVALRARMRLCKSLKRLLPETDLIK